jgi:Protein of unknown function (DUF2911)
MKLIRHQLAALTLALCIFSCKENEKQPVVKNEIPKDTIRNVTPDNVINPYATVDVSPMDMSYYPVDYPKLKMANNSIPPPVVRVVYSRPHLQGRHLFTQVLKYRDTWRLGANESTELQLYRDVMIQDKKIKAGRYILYCIPEADKWTIVVNSNTDSWGLKQDSSKDVQRFVIPSIHDHAGPSLEYFTIVFEKTATGADMIMAWGDIAAKLPFQF